MKKEELKRILQPMIEQTVKEVLLQKGVLAEIVAEIMQGMAMGQAVIAEQQMRSTSQSQAQPMQPRQPVMPQRARLRDVAESYISESRRKLQESPQLSPLFAGTSPLKSGASVADAITTPTVTTPLAAAATAPMPMSAQEGDGYYSDPSNPGVDLSQFGLLA